MSNFSVLLIGPPGAGKTTVAATAPKPVLFLDMDNKLHKMENIKSKLESGDVIQWAIDEPLIEVKLTRLLESPTKPGEKFVLPRPKGYFKLAEMIDNLEASKCIIEHRGNKVKVKTVVLDSYTSVNEHLKRLLMSVNQSNTVTQPLYGMVLINFEALNNTLLRLDANIIMICHEKVDKDELSGAISYRPLIDGQMSNKIGKDFEEVYFMEKVVKGETAFYEMLTIGTSLKPCRTSRILPARVVPDFEVIYGKKD